MPVGRATPEGAERAPAPPVAASPGAAGKDPWCPRLRILSFRGWFMGRPECACALCGSSRTRGSRGHTRPACGLEPLRGGIWPSCHVASSSSCSSTRPRSPLVSSSCARSSLMSSSSYCSALADALIFLLLSDVLAFLTLCVVERDVCTPVSPPALTTRLPRFGGWLRAPSSHGRRSMAYASGELAVCPRRLSTQLPSVGAAG